MSFTSPKFILRAVEALFAIVAFGTAASTAFPGEAGYIGFMIFTGVVAFLLCLVFMIAYFNASFNSKIVGLPEFIITSLWVLFWFAASTALAASDLNTKACDLFNCSNIRASIAFGYFSFLTWGVSAVMAHRDWKGARQ